MAPVYFDRKTLDALPLNEKTVLKESAFLGAVKILAGGV